MFDKDFAVKHLRQFPRVSKFEPPPPKYLGRVLLLTLHQGISGVTDRVSDIYFESADHQSTAKICASASRTPRTPRFDNCYTAATTAPAPATAPATCCKDPS